MVSQKSIPGSADFHALLIIFFQSLPASITFFTRGLSESTGYCCTKGKLLITAFINSSVIFTDTLAPVTFPDSSFASIKSSASGCLILMVSIRAPLLPSCATSRVEFEYRSINRTTPVEVSALLRTVLPEGRMCDRSCPTPPRLFISCTCSWSIFKIPP